MAELSVAVSADVGIVAVKGVNIAVNGVKSDAFVGYDALTDVTAIDVIATVDAATNEKPPCERGFLYLLFL